MQISQGTKLVVQIRLVPTLYSVLVESRQVAVGRKFSEIDLHHHGDACGRRSMRRICEKLHQRGVMQAEVYLVQRVVCGARRVDWAGVRCPKEDVDINKRGEDKREEANNIGENGFMDCRRILGRGREAVDNIDRPKEVEMLQLVQGDAGCAVDCAWGYIEIYLLGLGARTVSISPAGRT